MKVTIPNLLSLVRMGLTPMFIIAVVEQLPGRALAVFAVAGLTDALDGYLARKWDQRSRLGAFLDPIADKLLLMSSYIVLAVPGLHLGTAIPVWVTILVIARDLIIVTVALIFNVALGLSRFTPTWLSKVNTTVQITCVIVVLLSALIDALRAPAQWTIWAVAVTTVFSGLDYIRVGMRMAEEASDEELDAESSAPSNGGDDG